MSHDAYSNPNPARHINPADEPVLLDEISKAVTILNDVAGLIARDMHYDGGFSKVQACSLLISALGIALRSALMNMSHALEQPWSQATKDKFSNELDALLKRYAKEMYDKKDGQLN